MKQEYDKMTASDLLDLRLTINKETEKYKQISEAIEIKRVTIENALETKQFKYKRPLHNSGAMEKRMKKSPIKAKNEHNS